MIVWNSHFDELIYCSGKQLGHPHSRCPECHFLGYQHDRKSAVTSHDIGFVFPFDNMSLATDLSPN